MIIPGMMPNTGCRYDYDPAIFPDIVRAVDHFTSGWKDLGTVGTLAIRQKPSEVTA